LRHQRRNRACDKSLALELRERNVQVNAIAPGWVEMPMNADFRKSELEWMPRADERFGGSGAWMNPEEVVFLASGDADSVTGTVLFVDRGWSAY
jgi:2-dehydro-3-deoxy-D-gluconate 5-dehydrogenase